MPPKKPAPEPPEEVHEPEPPKLTPEETLAKAMGFVLRPADRDAQALIEKSTTFDSNPKMQEISAALQDHAVGAWGAKPKLPAARRSETLRTGGCGLVDRRMRELERGAPAPLVEGRPGLEQLQSTMEALSRPSSPASPASPPVREPHRIPPEEESAIQEAAFRRLARFSTDSSKGFYRDYTDKTMKRLLIDMDLTRDPERQRHYAHRTRCEHLDKSYGWYKQWTLKEEKKKTAPAPPYLRFSAEGPVSPGSMRVQFRQTSPLLKSHRLGQSASSPALLSASQTLQLSPPAPAPAAA